MGTIFKNLRQERIKFKFLSFGLLKFELNLARKLKFDEFKFDR
ncbi:hypothetical protein [Campylobacter showae]|nr:hypothetical protein [Campylobacter showae]